MSRRRFLAKAAAISAVGATGLGAYTWRLEPHWIEMVTRDMPLAGLPRRLWDQRLVQISDLHAGDEVDDNYLLAALRRVRSMRPAGVVITGDFMTCERGEQIAKTRDLLAELAPHETPTFAVLGNHDHGAHYRHPQVARDLVEALRSIGVRMLENETQDLHGLPIVGCGDLWAKECDLKAAIRGNGPTDDAIYLTHNPDSVDLPEWRDARGWVLAGHTHGGQCRFPFLGAPILPVENRDYVSGEIALSEGRRLYINRGLGYKMRVRFGARPEITTFRLAPLDGRQAERRSV
ncbi:metallophosphoesterase [Pseudobythopirellula maris]|nr:metallophosphoesterase [Pseudobythopirellula maris]